MNESQQTTDTDPLKPLGPLTAMAGIWEGEHGLDVSPRREGSATQAFIERIELQPIEPQSNGSQQLLGLRYHTHIVKPGDKATYHDQIGYWLWEPPTGMIIQTLTIPRGQTVLAIGQASAEATWFELTANSGSTINGICSNPFLEQASRAIEYRIAVTLNEDGTWSYEQDTVLIMQGQTEPFRHTDRNTLRRIGEATTNLLA